MGPRTLHTFPKRTYLFMGLTTLLIGNAFAWNIGLNSADVHQISGETQWTDKVPVIYDSSGIDGDFQGELVKSVYVALRILDKDNVQPLFLDLSKLDQESTLRAAQKCAKILFVNQLNVVVSLLEGDQLIKFTRTYDSMSEKMGLVESAKGKLHIYTPRTWVSSWKLPSSVVVKSLQMSEEARALALINRVGKVGVQTLIPILDGDIQTQFELLKLYYTIGNQSRWMIKFTKPILLNDPFHSNKLKKILQEGTGIHENHLRIHDMENNSTMKHAELKPGILLLATKGSQFAMKIASERKHLLLKWFSPSILDFEEWAYKQSTLANETDVQEEVNRISSSEAVLGNGGQENNSSNGTTANNNLFGLYTVNFVGSKGWDNPLRRRILQELTTFTGATPRIVTAVLTYDATRLARDHIKNEINLPLEGLSGLVDFNKDGFRTNGTYLGTSSVPVTDSSLVTLLQPSTWILEDIISIKQNKGYKMHISDYDVATSSILTRHELLQIANSTRSEVGCKEHLMSVVTHDPFNQMPYHYFFSETSLPEAIVVPNHQGYGITFVCTHLNDDSSKENGTETEYGNDSFVSTLQMACTPGHRLSHPISCFRSNVNKRQKRNTKEKQNAVPSVQYQYSFSNSDPWNSQTSEWTNSKDGSSNQYYYQPSIENRDDYKVESTGYTKADTAAAEHTPTPAPPSPPASKLPELRQILKAAKPFVGACIGSTTGCAMCVLVLGRLPLGTLPAACTGPCFVGTFGSCGGLLGRVFSETTVICTELFRQGLLDVETFFADAEFGKHISESSPYTMQGYKLLATPLVEVMKTSKVVTNVVATFALPWAHHMKYLTGRSNDTNLTGHLIHLAGYPICNVIGRINYAFNNLTNNYVTYGILLGSPIFSFLVTILLTIIFLPNLGFSTSNQRYNIFQAAVILYILMSKSKQFIQSGLSYYFKAIGRST